MTDKQRDESQTTKGLYYIGCPSIFIELDKYLEDLYELEESAGKSKNGILSWRGHEVFIGFTEDGADGYFMGSEGYEVCVEHGMIGVFPKEMASDGEENLDLVELALSDCSVKDGVFKLGHIHIDTRCLPDDEIDDDEVETVDFLEKVREDRDTLKLLNREQLIRFIEFAVHPRNKMKCDDFSGVDLSGADLEDVDFTGAILRGANCKNVSFKGAEIYQVDFTGADLTGADFSGVDIDGVIFDRAILINANFEGAVEYDEGASFEGAIFEETSSDPSREMEALLSQVEGAFWTTVTNAYRGASVPEIDFGTQREVQEVMRKAIMSFHQQNS